ncbi:MAG: FAD-dependent oxidoreductase, partial [Pseudomonadota bacterium]
GTVTGDVFVDATGSRGGLSYCNKYGKGCVLCLVKCVAFGDRLGICEKAGAKLFDLHRPDGTIGQLGAGVTMYKSTLAPDLLKRLEKEGLLKIPLPPHLIDLSKLKMMGAGRSQAFLENVILGDIGPVAKAFGMVYMALDKVRQIPGFENVQMENPLYSSFNHVGFVAMAYRDNAFRVDGFENLLCAGEKADHGSVGGAIISGYMAGHNAARIALGKEPVVLPRTLALGDFIAYTQEKSHTEEGHTRTYQMARGEYWQRLQDIGLYTDDLGKIKKRVQDSGLEGFLNKKLN